MNDPVHPSMPLSIEWDTAAIAAAASAIGVRDLVEYLGGPLPPSPTITAMSMLVAKLPIGYSDTVLTMSVVPS
jgi:hypothetical protein